MSKRHRVALAHLLYGVKGVGGDFVLLTSEIGAGKTTVCRCLIEHSQALQPGQRGAGDGCRGGADLSHGPYFRPALDCAPNGEPT